MVEDDVSLPLSSRVTGEEAEYVEFRVEQGVSKSEVVRDGIRALIDQDDSWPPDSDAAGEDQESSTSDEDDDSEGGMLVPTDGGEEVSLDDPTSKLFDEGDVSLNPYSLTGWTDGEALAGQFDDNSSDDKRGRKWVYLGVANYLAGKRVSRYELSSALTEHLGIAEKTAESAIDGLVAEGHLYPHPSTKNGVLTDRLQGKVRLKLAGKTGEGSPKTALTEKEKTKYPADWNELLSSFDKFSKRYYYTNRDDYLKALANSLEAGIVAAARTKVTDDKHITTGRGQALSLTKKDQVNAWKQVLKEFYRILDAELSEFDISEFEFQKAMFNAAHMTAKEVGSEYHVELQETITEIVEEAKSAVEKESVVDSDPESSFDGDSEMSVEEAADLLGYEADDLDNVFDVEIEERFIENVQENHPDTSEENMDDDIDELGISEDFADLKEARDVLTEVVDEKQDPETDVSYGVDEDGENEESLSEQSADVDDEEVDAGSEKMEMLHDAQAEASSASDSDFEN